MNGRRPRWLDILVSGGVLVAVGVAAWLALTISGLRADNSRLHGEVSTLSKQVVDLGGTPRVTPQPGPAGSQGVSGQPGASGAPGGQGVPGRNGSAGSQGPLGSPGAVGASGAPGQPGSPGQDGATGAAGATGPKGDTGEQGPRGEPGPSGPPGPACPDGYQPEHVTVVTPGGPQDSIVCTKESP